MTYDEVVAIMGAPTQVDDLRGSFAGLSPGEDGYLVRYRPRLSKRAIWYLKRVGKLPNVYDEWFTAYFSISDGKLFGKLMNPPDSK